MKLATTVIVTLVGPLGWVFLAGFVGVSVLYVRLWRSSGARELRSLRQEIMKAREVLAKEREMVLSLQNRNDFLKTKLNEVHAECEELRHKVKRMDEAIELQRNISGKQSVLIAELTKRLSDAERHIIKLLAEQGRDIDPANLTGK